MVSILPTRLLPRPSLVGYPGAWVGGGGPSSSPSLGTASPVDHGKEEGGGGGGDPRLEGGDSILPSPPKNATGEITEYHPWISDTASKPVHPSGCEGKPP